MKNGYETHQLELKVCGPVFVGSGYEIQKKEYLFLSRNTLGVAEPMKLYLLAKRYGLEHDFEKFMVQDTKEDLRHWSLRNRIPLQELKACMRYIENAGDFQIEKGKKQIMACISDPYGNPYIPGSSIKGMLRTILLCAEILKTPEKYEKDAVQIIKSLREENQRRNKVLQRNIETIEQKTFRRLHFSETWNDAVNDILSGMIVSDSEPLSRDDVILCQKWEKHTDGKDKTLNLLRECMKPGVTIKSTLSFDRTRCKISPDDILEAVQLFYHRYYQTFQKKFSGIAPASERTVFLGGGSGFVSKTVLYSLFEEKQGIETVKQIFEKTNVPREHKHYQDSKLGVSPHILKCTRYEGKEYMMGQCELRIL